MSSSHDQSDRQYFWTVNPVDTQSVLSVSNIISHFLHGQQVGVLQVEWKPRRKHVLQFFWHVQLGQWKDITIKDGWIPKCKTFTQMVRPHVTNAEFTQSIRLSVFMGLSIQRTHGQSRVSVILSVISCKGSEWLFSK